MGERPLPWIKAHMDLFPVDLTLNEDRSCDLLRRMRATLPARAEVAFA